MTPDKEISQDEFERIEKFILGKMLPEEKNSFELEMKADLSLQKAVGEHRTLIQAIETGGLKEKLEQIHQSKFGTKPKHTSFKSWLPIAAAMAILVSVGIWLVDFTDAEDKIFAQYTSTDPGLPVPMSSTTNDYLFYDAMVDYKAEKYDSAIQKWSGILGDEPESNVLNYYIGSSYYNLEKYRQAIPFFAKAAKQETQEFSAKAQWYLILSQVKLKENDKVVSALPITDSPYGERIKEIQNKLKQ